MKTRVTMLLTFALLLAAGTALAGHPAGPPENTIGQALSGSYHAIQLAESNVLEIGAPVILDGLPFFNTVQSGYVIMADWPPGSPDDSTRWSDVMIFTAADHKPTGVAGDAANRAIIISDPITDAHLADLVGVGLPLITVADIRAARAVGYAYHIQETNTGITSWRPADGSMLYYGYSDLTVPAAGPSTLMVLFFALAAAGAILIWRKGRTGSELA